MPTTYAPCLALGLLLAGCASPAARPPAAEPPPVAELRREVDAVERAFARTMAARDLEGFARHVAEDAVFLAGDVTLRGRQAVVDAWAPLFRGPEAPFSWEPDQVEVLQGGAYAISTGPVRDATGRLVQRFTSLWRREASGAWRVVFDQGCEICP